MFKLATVRLAPEIMEGWRQAVIRLAKLPRGTSPRTHHQTALLQAVMRAEAKHIARLWTIFTQERDELSRHLLSDKRSAVAYLLGFHLANAARAQLVLSRSHIRYPLARIVRGLSGRIVWHDLGCGTGAVAQVVTHDLIKAKVPLERIEMHLADLSATLLAAATEVFKAGGWGDVVRSHRYALEKLTPARLAPAEGTALTGYSLGYVWNELARNQAAREALLGVFAERNKKNEDALILVLEPGTQELARGAMELRDELLALGYQVLYPCTHSQSCPMLSRSRDWCYSEAQWDAPNEILWVDELLDMDRRKLSGAGYLFASASLSKKLQQSAIHKRDDKLLDSRSIVVGRPVRTHGQGFDYLVCGADGLAKIPPESGEALGLRGLSLAPRKRTVESPRPVHPPAKAPAKKTRRP